VEMFEAKYKALSIKQPWAWLICTGYKDIENRDWFIGRKVASGMVNFTIPLPQRIYVHAGKQSDLTEETLNFIHKIVNPLTHEYGSTWRDVLSFGSIIGEVDITGCVKESKSPWFVGKYGFTLANPILYEETIPCKGKLGFFTPELNNGLMTNIYRR